MEGRHLKKNISLCPENFTVQYDNFVMKRSKPFKMVPCFSCVQRTTSSNGFYL